MLVIGLGPAGRQVVQTLIAHRLEPVLVDVNPESRDYARQQGLRLHLGDAGHEEVLVHAGLADVCMVVVTVPDPHTAVTDRGHDSAAAAPDPYCRPLPVQPAHGKSS